MPAKSEILAVLLVVVPAAIVLPLKQANLQLVNHNIWFFFLAASLPIYSLATYWAFDTRRALSVRIYRSQALSLGIFTMTTWFSSYGSTIFSNSSNISLSFGVTAISFITALLAFYYFTDVSMKAARRSDPLLRDTLYWSKVRIPLWILVGFGFGIIFAITAFAIVTNNTDLLNSINNGSFSNPVFNFAFNYYTYVPFVGIIYLPAAAIRAKWNRGLRLHFFWITLDVISFFVLANFNIPGTFVILFLLGGYFLFRAAKSLAPVTQAPKLEVPMEPPATSRD